jgi:hypothetical protein
MMTFPQYLESMAELMKDLPPVTMEELERDYRLYSREEEIEPDSN